MNEKLLRLINYEEHRYPHALEKQYLRILEKIIELWDSPQIDAYFTDLLVADRPDRVGFPPEVASDIVYLSMVNSKRQELESGDAWDGVLVTLKNEIEQQGLPFTPAGFIKAAELCNTEAVGKFLEAKVNVDTVDERQWTPLMISAFCGTEEMASLLIQCGANVHHKDNAGYTPLHWAALNGYSTVVKLLLKKGADVNERSQHGWTALLQACTKGHLTVASMLLEYGAAVNAATNDGWTALHKASANGHLAEVKLLLSKGADRSLKYSDGMTALDLAKKHKHDEIAAILADRRTVER